MSGSNRGKLGKADFGSLGEQLPNAVAAFLLVELLEFTDEWLKAGVFLLVAGGGLLATRWARNYEPNGGDDANSVDSAATD